MGSINKYTDDHGNTFADCPKCGMQSLAVGAGADLCIKCTVRKKYKKSLARMLRRRARR